MAGSTFEVRRESDGVEQTVEWNLPPSGRHREFGAPARHWQPIQLSYSRGGRRSSGWLPATLRACRCRGR